MAVTSKKRERIVFMETIRSRIYCCRCNIMINVQKVKCLTAVLQKKICVPRDW